MRVLIVHNYYQQPGGEDQVFHAEGQLLRERGHSVLDYTEHNENIGGANKLQLALETTWSQRQNNKLASVLAEFRPELAHFHNTFPLISPAAYYACSAANIPVVQTLHNYRLGCPKATYYRDGRLCHDCRGKLLAWPGIVHACYHDSRSTTGAIAVMNSAHRLMGTWAKRIDTYIALSEFAKVSFIADGLPATSISVKGNFLAGDPGVGAHPAKQAIFVGRLTAEKGVLTMLKAWRHVGSRLPLKIVGDGPLASTVAEVAGRTPGVEWLGRRPSHEVLELIGVSEVLIFPSEWDEPFGLVAIEAFAKGTPVIAAAAGAIPEIVEHQRTGLLYQPGSADQLAAWIDWSIEHPGEIARMGTEARRAFETRYTAQHNYEALMAIYRPLLARHG